MPSTERSTRWFAAPHRPDVNIEQDLIEEVARIRGLDEIPTVLPAIEPQVPRTSGALEREVAGIAVSLGLSREASHVFLRSTERSREAESCRARGPPAEPLSEERSVLEPSLLPGLLEAVGRARRRGQEAGTLVRDRCGLLARRQRASLLARTACHA